MLGGDPLELRHQLRRGAALEVRPDPEHDRLEALVLERAAPARDAALGRDVGQRLTAKQRERVAQQHARVVRLGSGLLDELVEPPHVELELGSRERVAGRVEHEQSAEQRAQLREMDVKRGHRARRRPLPPQLIDQPIPRERHAAREQQEREQ